MWTYDALPELFDPGIFVTSIQAVVCLSNTPLGGITWSCSKRDLDGSTHGFPVTGTPSSPPNVPMAGYWSFALAPLGTLSGIAGTACFNLTFNPESGVKMLRL
jgi:hypothetical protein